MWKFKLGSPIVSALTGILLPLTGMASTIAAENASKERTIRAGREIAIDACTGCHIVSPHQEFHPLIGDTIPTFEEIANRPGATEDSLLGSFTNTHRNKDLTRTTSIYTTTYISDSEVAEVIAYMLTQKHGR